MGRELRRAEQGDLLQGLLSPEAGITSSLLYTPQEHPRSFASSPGRARSQLGRCPRPVSPAPRLRGFGLPKKRETWLSRPEQRWQPLPCAARQQQLPRSTLPWGGDTWVLHRACPPAERGSERWMKCRERND